MRYGRPVLPYCLGGLVSDLTLHMQIEEKIFYPAVKELETKKAEEMVLGADRSITWRADNVLAKDRRGLW
jgi:hypothetical protein